MGDPDRARKDIAWIGTVLISIDRIALAFLAPILVPSARVRLRGLVALAGGIRTTPQDEPILFAIANAVVAVA